MTATTLTILDGPLGTELAARNVPTPLPLWSAWALRHRPEVVAEIHRTYAEAGATVHTTNTFRTKRRTCPDDWEALARRAVRLAREAVPDSHRIAGSVSPLEDCYSPELSPEDPRPEHRELIDVLAGEGVDLLLCETFPHPGEAFVAIEEAVSTGLPTWVSFTPGPDADLLTPQEVATAAGEAARLGAEAVLVNCLPSESTATYLHAMREAVAGASRPVALGAYPNSGTPDSTTGWKSKALNVESYLASVEEWIAAGATILGGCCGTGPEHVRALVRRRSAAGEQ